LKTVKFTYAIAGTHFYFALWATTGFADGLHPAMQKKLQTISFFS
jgi:hypothetical protein